MSDTTMDTVERLTRRRARLASAMGVFLIVLQAGREIGDGPLRTVDYFNIIGWALWTLTMVLFLVFGGALWRGRAVRGMLNDESTEANRQNALAFGFWVMLAVAALLFAASLYTDVSAREALQALVTLGVAATLLRFGALERRALKE